jgi:hypothetical protein
MGLWLSFSFTCSTKLKNARGKLAEGRFGIYSAARRSWPFGFRPVALRRRLSAGLPFRYGTFSCKGAVSYFGWQNKKCLRANQPKAFKNRIRQLGDHSLSALDP